MQALTFGYLSVADLTPVEVIRAAARAGFASAGIRISGRKPGDGFLPDVIGDARAIKEIRSCLDDSGVRLASISTYHLYPNIALDDLLPVIETTAALGADYIVAASYEPDHSRMADLMGKYSRRAAEAGLKIAFETVSYSAVPTLESAVMLTDMVNEPNFGLLLDPLHIARGGSAFANIAQIDPKKIFFAQLCDASATKPDGIDLATEAKSMRLYPGEGALPLREFLSLLPAGLEIEAELPIRADRHLSGGERAGIAHKKCTAYLSQGANKNRVAR